MLVVTEPVTPETLAQAAIEHLLARVSERRVAEVVAEPDRLDQVLVEPQRPGDRPGDLRDLDRVGQTRPVVVPLRGDEDLRLVLEAAERLAVDDPVAVALRTASAGRSRAPAGREQPGSSAWRAVRAICRSSSIRRAA